MSKLYDKNRREIMVGDVLKVFHFTGARRKRYYMYKQVKCVTHLGENKLPYLEIDHLGVKEEVYWERANGRVLDNYEIVQGFSGGFGEDGNVSFEDRPKLQEDTG